jgi:hypothetical protein
MDDHTENINASTKSILQGVSDLSILPLPPPSDLPEFAMVTVARAETSTGFGLTMVKPFVHLNKGERARGDSGAVAEMVRTDLRDVIHFV